MLSISTDSGHVERLGSLPSFRNPVVLSHDGRAIYLSSQFSHELVRWEIGTQETTTVDRSPGLLISDGVVSPDERWITRREKWNIEIRPMLGGDWKPLVSQKAAQHIAFTPDGNWLIYSADDAAGKPAIFRVATTGGQPERIGEFPATEALRFLSISPDGQKIVATVFNPSDIWLLENFEPKKQAAR
jgi:tricorn protease-like protein